MGCCISKCVDLFIHECTRQVGCIVPNFDVEFEPEENHQQQKHLQTTYFLRVSVSSCFIFCWGGWVGGCSLPGILSRCPS